MMRSVLELVLETGRSTSKTVLKLNIRKPRRRSISPKGSQDMPRLLDYLKHWVEMLRCWIRHLIDHCQGQGYIAPFDTLSQRRLSSQQNKNSKYRHSFQWINKNWWREKKQCRLKLRLTEKQAEENIFQNGDESWKMGKQFNKAWHTEAQFEMMHHFNATNEESIIIAPP